MIKQLQKFLAIAQDSLDNIESRQKLIEHQKEALIEHQKEAVESFKDRDIDAEDYYEKNIYNTEEEIRAYKNTMRAAIQLVIDSVDKL